MANAVIPPKAVKILAVLNETKKSGTSNLLHRYKINFPNDYMHLKLLIAHLDFLYHSHRIKKLVRYKDNWKGDSPQTYEITEKGVYSLNKWGLI